MIKKEIRVLGVACAIPHRSIAPSHVVGVVYRGNRWLEGVMRTVIPRKQANLAPAVAKMIVKSPHFPQLRVIVLDELITKSGNYMDIEGLSRKTGLPAVAVLRRKIPVKCLPRARTGRRRVLKAFASLPCRKWRAAGKTYSVYSAGLDEVDLDELLQVCSSREGLPEAVRVARIAAASLEKFLVERVS